MILHEFPFFTHPQPDLLADMAHAQFCLVMPGNVQSSGHLADAFFTGLYETALKPGELITAVSFPIPQKAAYIKYKQPASRFALVGVFVAQTSAGVRVAVTGAAGSVFRCKPLEDALGKSFTPEAAKAVKVSADGLNGDLHGSAAYRAAMISVMASRAVAAALAR